MDTIDIIQLAIILIWGASIALKHAKGVFMQELVEGGTLMTVNEFVECCLSSLFIDDDGYAVYAYEKNNSIVKTNMKIFPSDIFFNSVDHSYPYVIWYNR